MYIAILRPKRGELAALNNLKINSKYEEGKFIPTYLLEKLDLSDKYVGKSKKIREKPTWETCLKKIFSNYPHHSFLDVRSLSQEDIYYIEKLLIEDNDFKEFEILYDLNFLVNQLEHKDNIRINIDYLECDLDNIIDNVKIINPKLIVFDMESINDNLVSEEVINKLIILIEKLDDLDICLASCAIPEFVPTDAYTDYKMQRYEKKLFETLQRRINKKIYYGDYGTYNPFKSGTSRNPPVQIKYTKSEVYWFVRNGRFKSPYNFYDVCIRISKSEDFDSNFSWADNLIQNIAKNKKNKGGTTEWASLGINRHLELCIFEDI